MAIKISDLTNLQTAQSWDDEDRILLSVKDQPTAGQWESRAVEGLVLKGMMSAVTKTVIEPAQILQLGTVPVILTNEDFSTINKFVVPDAFIFNLDYQGDKYEGNVDVEIGYTNSAVFSPTDAVMTSQRVLDLTADFVWAVPPDLLKDKGYGIKQNLNLGIQATGGTQPTTGDSRLTITTVYRVFEV